MDVNEAIARIFHATYEEIAPGLGWQTQESSRVRWEELPASQRELMLQTVGRLLEADVIRPGAHELVAPALQAERAQAEVREREVIAIRRAVGSILRDPLPATREELDARNVHHPDTVAAFERGLDLDSGQRPIPPGMIHDRAREARS